MDLSKVVEGELPQSPTLTEKAPNPPEKPKRGRKKKDPSAPPTPAKPRAKRITPTPVTSNPRPSAVTSANFTPNVSNSTPTTAVPVPSTSTGSVAPSTTEKSTEKKTQKKESLPTVFKLKPVVPKDTVISYSTKLKKYTERTPNDEERIIDFKKILEKREKQKIRKRERTKALQEVGNPTTSQPSTPSHPESQRENSKESSQSEEPLSLQALVKILDDDGSLSKHLFNETSQDGSAEPTFKKPDLPTESSAQPTVPSKRVCISRFFQIFYFDWNPLIFTKLYRKLVRKLLWIKGDFRN
jgi:hypothetical protein